MIALTEKPVLVERAINGYVVQTREGLLVFVSYDALMDWLETVFAETLKH